MFDNANAGSIHEPGIVLWSGECNDVALGNDMNVYVGIWIVLKRPKCGLNTLLQITIQVPIKLSHSVRTAI